MNDFILPQVLFSKIFRAVGRFKSGGTDNASNRP